jgi:hypothetical protein
VKRRVAAWPIAVLAVVLVLALSWGAWSWIGGALDRRAAAQAASCSSGNSTIRVIVTPQVYTPASQAAQAWNDTRPVVYDHCIHVDVTAMDSATVLTSLTQGWDTSKLGPAPQAWLPDSSLWANRLTAQNSSLVGSAPTSIATSPVVLAVGQDLFSQMQSCSAFQWSDLAGAPKCAAVGKYQVGIPNTANNPASALAVQSALAGVTTSVSGPVTSAMLTQSSLKSVISGLSAEQPADLPDTTANALMALSNGAANGYNALPVTEIDLYRRDTGADGTVAPANQLYEVMPGGPTPSADFPYIPLAGDQVDNAQSRAAQVFKQFLLESDQQKALAQAGLRVASTTDHPTDAAGMRWDPTTAALIPADLNTTEQISAAWTTGNQVVTLMTDTSASMGVTEAGKTRLSWAQQALTGQVNHLVSGNFGLWEFGKAIDNASPYRQLVPTGSIVDQNAQLLTAINTLTLHGNGHSLFTSIKYAYKAAEDSYQAGKHNRLVVVTSGANDTGLTLDKLTAALTTEAAANPVQINIIVIGNSVDRADLTTIAHQTGGSISVVKDGSGIDAALSQVLSSN